MEAIQKAGVPDKFSLQFLTTLGFKSTNDRPIVAVLKSLNFLDQNGVPTDFYKEYKNAAKGKLVLGRRISEAYGDIFLANEKAHTLKVDELKGIFAAATGKSDSVAIKMASTFKELCSIADFKIDLSEVHAEKIATQETEQVVNEVLSSNQVDKTVNVPLKSPEFHYNIQIHLPVTKDITVYNAIFKSLRDHLMQ